MCPKLNQNNHALSQDYNKLVLEHLVKLFCIHQKEFKYIIMCFLIVIVAKVVR